MKCHQIKDNLSMFLANELNSQEQYEITTHLIHCQKCRDALQQLKVTYNLLTEYQPVFKIPFAMDVFLPQVRQKINSRTSTVLYKNSVSRFIPAFASALIVLIAIILFSARHRKVEPEIIILNDMMSIESSESSYLNNLDETTQDIVAQQMFDGIADANLLSLESALIASLDEDELITSLTAQEQEVFMNQILTQYKEALGEINPEWLPTEPVISEPTSLGG